VSKRFEGKTAIVTGASGADDAEHQADVELLVIDDGLSLTGGIA
jgi:hypothetical protein